MVPKNVSIFCPHCGQHTAISPAPLAIFVQRPNTPPNDIAEEEISKWIGNQEPHYQYGTGRWWMGKCNACQKPVLVKDIGGVVYPPPQPGPISEAIPEPMRSDLREAKQNLTVSSWNSAAVMARRALQGAALEQGAPHGHRVHLHHQIAWLFDNHKITATQRRAADATRWVGNDGAHPEPPDADDLVVFGVTEDDARVIVRLVESLFTALYDDRVLAEQQHAKHER
jgi:Domain of unknown function (DUF4145)